MFTSKGQSKIFLNPKGWIEMVWGKVIDKDEYLFIGQHLISMITRLEDEGQEALLLVDFTALETATAEAATMASSATNELNCRKIAGFGAKPNMRGMLDSIKTRSKRTDIIREFDTREEAEAWLLEK